MAFKMKDKVRLIQPEIAGDISDIEYNKDTDTLRYLMNFADATGEEHQRWFDEEQLEKVDVQ